MRDAIKKNARVMDELADNVNNDEDRSMVVAGCSEGLTNFMHENSVVDPNEALQIITIDLGTWTDEAVAV